ncbi:MAG: nucleotidyltransferase family protein [Phycisphaerales bacterium]
MIAPALILAAGRGTRMGSPKALMDCYGTPWWTIQLDRLHAACVESVWIVSPAVEAVLSIGSLAPATRVIADSSKPMFASILAGIDTVRDRRPSGIYILPIDVPASSDPKLWQALRSTQLPTAPTFRGKRGHPVFLPWNWIVSTLDLAVHASDKLRLDELIRPTLLEIPVNDPGIACNLNTPEDLRLFLEPPDSDTPA